MVRAIGSGKMTALARRRDAGSVLQIATEEVSPQKSASQYNGKDLRDADEANLLDEEDMHIFGLMPMTDPLDLVCCNACKKPIKASQYASHAELCLSLGSRDEISLENDVPAVNMKPLRKDMKKLPIAQTKKATSVRGSKRFESVDFGDIAAPESHVDEKIQMSLFTESKRNLQLSSTHKLNGSRVNPYNLDCSEDMTECLLKPLKRTAAENLENPDTKNLCKTTFKVHPYVPAPLATKIYYSLRNHNLRRAISHMFFEESNKKSSNEVSKALQVNAAPKQTSSPGNYYHEQVAIQQRENNFLHLVQTPDQLISTRPDFYVGKSGAFAPSMETAAQHPVNNSLGFHYMLNSYSFADNAGNPLSTVQQGSGSVPVV